MRGSLKVELGGGRSPREGFYQLDVEFDGKMRDGLVPNGRRWDLDEFPWPLTDGECCELYASHVLEHLKYPHLAVREIARVCDEGSRVEIRVPHHFSQMAMCPGHLHIIGPDQVRHWCHDFVPHFFQGWPRRLFLSETHFVRSSDFDELRRLHPGWTDEQVLRLVAGAAHESRFVFRVIANEVCP